MYQPNLPLEAGRYVTASKEHIALSLEAATEGMVLLKNENNILPLKNGSRITLFGRGSFDYVKGGGGSGGRGSGLPREFLGDCAQFQCISTSGDSE